MKVTFEIPEENKDILYARAGLLLGQATNLQAALAQAETEDKDLNPAVLNDLFQEIIQSVNAMARCVSPLPLNMQEQVQMRVPTAE